METLKTEPSSSINFPVVEGGLEPPASTLSVWRSNQLSYPTIFGTGERIRTSIDGFGDRYATIAPHPCLGTNMSKNFLLHIREDSNP